MQQVSAYQTTDGKLFCDITDAREHQRVLDFREWYSDRSLYGVQLAGGRVSASDMLAWLDEHSSSLKAFAREVTDANT